MTRSNPGARSATLRAHLGNYLLLADRANGHALGRSEPSLDTVTRQEDFAAKFQGQCYMQEIKAAATQALRMLDGKFHRTLQGLIKVHGHVHQNSTLLELFQPGQGDIPFPENCGASVLWFRAKSMK